MAKEEVIGSERNARTGGLPVTYYNIKDLFQTTVQDRRFMDAAMLLFAFAAAALAMPYYPVIIAVILAAALFIASMRHPFLGLVVLAIIIFPMMEYQSPGIAWMYVFAFTVVMVLGFINYRAIILAYLLLFLPFSALGGILFIPFLIATPLIIGFKRSAILIAIVTLAIIAFSAMSGIHNSAYILYSSSSAHTSLSSSQVGQILNYTTVNKPMLNIGNLISGSVAASGVFLSQKLLDPISDMFGGIALSLTYHIIYLAQLAVTIVIFFFIDAVAVGKRSKYRGFYGSLFGVIYPLFYILLTAHTSYAFAVLPLLSFMIAPLALALLALYNINVVKALDVRKQDIRIKFGEAFEDMQTESANETFDNIADYKEVKREMMRSIIYPIEQRGVSRAYNIRPVKGVLLFGPPGNGKTMLMRALANEIHFGFYRIVAPNIISALPGESEKKLSQVFGIAKKNAPCILFIDEIDAIAQNRSSNEGDETHKYILTQLLEELDGFQKIERVIVVGATNRPDAIDPAILRPGRFDRSVYIPLPDSDARKEIFSMYLSKLPVSKDVDFGELAKITERFSAADIRNVCDLTAQSVAQDALESHKFLQITNANLIRTIKSTKPSTRLVDVERYTRFKADFERTHNILSKDAGIGKSVSSIDTVIGLDKPKDMIVSLMQSLAHPELAKRYGIRGVSGILMYGPPGTGKSLMMKMISRGIPGVTMVEVDTSEILRSGNDAPAMIRDYFYRAQENKPSILFIDEIDGIVGSRDRGSEYNSELVSEFLKQMDGMRSSTDVMIVGATNRPFDLDPAILRPGRFDKLVYIGPPNAGDRKRMFIRFLKNAPISTLDFDKLADMTDGFTGADIDGVCNEAKRRMMNSAVDSKETPDITQELLEEIIGHVSPSAPEELLDDYTKFRKRYGGRE